MALVALTESDMIGFINSSCALLVASVCFRILRIPDEDALNRSCIYLWVMSSQYEDECFATYLMNVRVVWASSSPCFMRCDLLERFSECALMKVRSSQIELISHVGWASGCDSHSSCLPHERAMHALDFADVCRRICRSILLY